MQLAKKSSFNSHLAANEISPNSIVFIKETGEIYVNGKFYSNNKQTDTNTEAIASIQEQNSWWVEPEKVTICTYTTSDGNIAKCHFMQNQGIQWWDSLPSSVTNVYENGQGKIDGLTELGNYAFASCETLITFEISEEITSIGESAFENCKNLNSITIPNSVTSIDNSVFYGCKNLITITIPEGVTSIGSRAIKNCINLKTINLPSTLTTTGEGFIDNCENLEAVYFNGTLAQWNTLPNLQITYFDGSITHNVDVICTDGTTKG